MWFIFTMWDIKVTPAIPRMLMYIKVYLYYVGYKIAHLARFASLHQWFIFTMWDIKGNWVMLERIILSLVYLYYVGYKNEFEDWDYTYRDRVYLYYVGYKTDVDFT